MLAVNVRLEGKGSLLRFPFLLFENQDYSPFYSLPMKNVMTPPKLALALFFLLFLTACPSPPSEEVRQALTQEQYDSIMKADMPPLRVRRSKEQLQSQEEWE